jgi:crotonobetainyl-CoA:carnitine CoA-transferase CaiB-like acyl-CoA transferase
VPAAAIDARAGLTTLWREHGHDPAALEHLDPTGREPVLPSSFAVGTAMQVSVAVSAFAAAEIWHARTGRRQRVGVDMRAAAVAARSERYLTIDGGPAPELWDKIAGTYECGDGRYVRLHTNFRHHRDGVLKLLQCAYDRTAVGQALRGWKAFDFEEAAAEAKLVVTAMRTFREWDAHPQGAAISRLPLMSIERIGDAPAPAWPSGDRPLAGIKVLDLTRIIAGPVGGLTLAAHGAEVMLVTSPHLPSVAPLVIDTGRGKLSTQLDLHDPAGRHAFEALLREADVIVQGYRPGGLEALGYGPADLARRRPGIVYVSLSLLRRSRKGGSWHVRASLAQTGYWLRSHGRIDGLGVTDPAREDVLDCLEVSASGFAACRPCVTRRCCRKHRYVGPGRRCRSARIRRRGRANLDASPAAVTSPSSLPASAVPSIRASSARCRRDGLP